MDDATALSTAARLIDAGQDAAALGYVGPVLAHDPGHPLARLYEVMALEGVDPERARDRAESLASDHPDWAEAWTQLTFILAHHDTPARAAAAAGRALQLDPQNPQVHLSMSDALVRIDNYQESLDAVDRALAMGVQSWRAQLRRGHCLFMLGRRAEGIEIVSRVVGEHPSEPEAVKMLAALEADVGHHERALRLANEAATEAMGQKGTAEMARRILVGSLNRVVLTWLGSGLGLSVLWGQIWHLAPGHNLVVAALSTGAVMCAQVLVWPGLSRGQTRRTVIRTIWRDRTTAVLMGLALFLYAQPLYSAIRWQFDQRYHNSTPVLVIIALAIGAAGSAGGWLRSVRTRGPKAPPRPPLNPR
ncbi:hypothetical protein C0Z10_00490 [Acidipropionibacterium jensenii]|uniref:Uncharacterized protein n=1 Tax=Acidipropionibacterium jensenii TaxID=1749 RepID=A0A3Q9UJB2_9ACTN|nr:tetratricopeptide repeat protein [Acidipropionibacterium jensenii]AZZ38483.1 hypothetical protein C0Z10_00490 [Acidipropionibacterium jensenii]